ncbi:MAG TPA: Gfo/Idh/MocA family oxidoreductase [Armatimonadota bacterium]|nr:Gfo/Idh/MocA family oxidoreductase [Armatimonadota bacterium]
MEPLRWGILGCGDIAEKTFAPCLLHSPRCELVAVSCRDGDRARAFAEKFHVPHWYSDDAALLARSDIDAVVIATPPHVHHEQTLAAAAHGKHVLVEKPMAHFAAECREMIHACDEARVRLGVAYRRRLFPQVLRLQELIEEGAIGRVTLVREHYSGWMDVPPGDWRVDPEIAGGGALMDMACHRLEVMLNVGGPATEVTAIVETLERDWQVDDTGCLLLRFASGALGIHSTTLTSPPRHDTLQVEGTRGKLILDPLEHWADCVRLVTPEGEQRIPVEPVTAEFQDLAMIEDFVTAVREEREPVCNAAAGLHTQEVITAAYESARIRRAVAL